MIINKCDYMIYDGAVVKESNIGNNAIIGTDSYVRNCDIADEVIIERRAMVFDSEVGFASQIGYNSVVRNCSIGRFCSISWGGSLNGMNHLIHSFSTFSFQRDNVDHPKCNIGNDVWIGGNVVTVNGVCIGDGAIIGAGSVVTKDIPAYAIAVGNPARVVKYRFCDNYVDRLLELKWWNWPQKVIYDNLPILLKSSLNDDILKIMEEIKKNLKDDI